jgi:hypothetical protein
MVNFFVKRSENAFTGIFQVPAVKRHVTLEVSLGQVVGQLNIALGRGPSPATLQQGREGRGAGDDLWGSW